MDILESIMGQLGPSILGQLGKQAGADQQQTANAIQAALPAILAGLAKNSGNNDGAGALASALDRDHDGSILDDLGGFLNSGRAEPEGQSILKHVFGRRQSNIERNLGKETGLSGAAMGKILASVAPMVMGALGKAKRQQGFDPGALAEMLGQQRRQIEKKQPASMGILNSILDADGDGDVDAADLVKRGGGLLGRLFGRR